VTPHCIVELLKPQRETTPSLPSWMGKASSLQLPPANKTEMLPLKKKGLHLIKIGNWQKKQLNATVSPHHL